MLALRLVLGVALGLAVLPVPAVVLLARQGPCGAVCAVCAEAGAAITSATAARMIFMS